ncbi:hypothetical protein [Actinoplanes sp. NPDC051859]|uniref:hypothetical protein n=1 Tax=Actinoplanes sp. NPDC051859 TaxID=3363909 RepID=UPI00378D8376
MSDYDKQTAVEAQRIALATAYRHLQLRSLSLGDVLRIRPGGGPTSWLVCAPFGWAPIPRPADTDRHYPVVNRNDSEESDASTVEQETEIRTMRVHELALECGHLVTHIAEGLIPVSVSCCDRLGSTQVDDDLHWSFSSRVDFGRELADQVRYHPASSPQESAHVLLRRPRTDDPYVSEWAPWSSHSGRFPSRVGASTRHGAPGHTASLTAAPGC